MRGQMPDRDSKFGRMVSITARHIKPGDLLFVSPFNVIKPFRPHPILVIDRVEFNYQCRWKVLCHGKVEILKDSCELWRLK